MDSIIQDLRFTLRTLRKKPLFTMIAVGTLALGIGANTATFTAIRYLLLDPLEVEAPDELNLVYWVRPSTLPASNINSSVQTDPETGAIIHSNYNYMIYRELQAAGLRMGAEICGFTFARELSVAVDDQPPIIGGGLLADGLYFSTLGVGMTLGRTIGELDDQPGAPPVAVISHSFWRRAFGSDSGVIGRTLRVNGVPFDIIGVTGPGFRGISQGGFFPQTDVTLPLAAQPLVTPAWGPEGGSLFTSDGIFWIRLLARLPDDTDQGAFEEIMTQTLGTLLPSQTPNDAITPLVQLRPGTRGEQALQQDGKRLLLLLVGVVSVVLLIACINLAGLMLARGVARRHEIAVRQALGASRLRLVRLVLLESLILTFAGAAGGLLLTLGSSALLSRLVTAGLGTFGLGSLMMEVRIDTTLLAVTAGIASLAMVFFGIWPALRLTTQVNPRRCIGQIVTGALTPRLTPGRVLIALQMGVSIPLVVGALLLLRTISNLGDVPLGFDPRGIAVFRLNPEYTGESGDQYHQVYQNVLREIETVPGVISATLVENALMSGVASNDWVTIDTTATFIWMNAVGPGFFETLGMQLIAGRAPGFEDGWGAPDVAVLNEAAVEQLFGGTSPIGRVVNVGNRQVEIIGVVSDSRYHQQRADVRPILFDAALQRAGFGGHHVMVKTSVPQARLEHEIRRAVARVYPDLPISELRSQQLLIEQSSAREHLFSQLLALFAGFALLLASIGVHGVTAYTVNRRVSEIGVRVALGAGPRQVLWLVLRQVFLLAGVGIVLGVPLAIAAGSMVRALLYGITPTNLETYFLAAVVLMAVSLVAGALPARRAIRLDPMEALRRE